MFKLDRYVLQNLAWSGVHILSQMIKITASMLLPYKEIFLRIVNEMLTDNILESFGVK
jgi:hypothetical protein